MRSTDYTVRNSEAAYLGRNSQLSRALWVEEYPCGPPMPKAIRGVYTLKRKNSITITMSPGLCICSTNLWVSNEKLRDHVLNHPLDSQPLSLQNKCGAPHRNRRIEHRLLQKRGISIMTKTVAHRAATVTRGPGWNSEKSEIHTQNWQATNIALNKRPAATLYHLGPLNRATVGILWGRNQPDDMFCDIISCQ